MKKGEILQLLSEKPCVSGEEMAEHFGVSRAAVWKTVQALIREGYPIVSNRGQGYSLTENDLVFAEKLRPVVSKEIKTILCFDSVDSTNRLAKQYAEEHPNETALFVADGQTAGRGRKGHSFDSEKGQGVYMSLLLYPKIPAENAIRMTTSAAVAVCETIEALTGCQTGIKWVNDVYIGGKKAVGILTEGAFDLENGEFRYAVIGIGINVKKRAFPKELEGIATSVEEATGIALCRAKIIEGIVNRLVKRAPDDEYWLDGYRKRMFLIGKRVNVLSANGTYPAEVISVLDDGALLVKDEAGQERKLSSGDVSIREA